MIATFIAISPVAALADFSIATWSIEGPTKLNTKDLDGFGEFVGDLDVVVIEELLGKSKLQDATNQAGLSAWNYAISNFSKDSLSDPFSKQELAVITSHGVGTVKEIDPVDFDDTTAMQALDEDFTVPGWIPADQRKKKGGRGWLWVEIPSLKLVVVAIHLKPSRGKSGAKDEENSFKCEAVASALDVEVRKDSRKPPNWSYVVAGDFSVAPGDADKLGVEIDQRCGAGTCSHFDQPHAIFRSGLVYGLAMRNLTIGLSATYAKGAFVDSPIDNIYAHGPIFDTTTRMVAEKGPDFGADHFAVRISVD